MVTQTTTWRFLYENMPDGDVDILLGDGRFYRLAYCTVSHVDGNGRLLGDGDTIYWAIEDGEYNDSPIENKITWRAYPDPQGEPAQEQNKMVSLIGVLDDLHQVKELIEAVETTLDEIISQNDEVALLNQEIRKLTEENALLRLQNARLNAFGKGEVSA